MTVATIQVNDIGVVIEVHAYTLHPTTKAHVDVNLSAATAMQITARSPSATTKTFTAVLSGDGTDGLMRYVTTASTDFDEIGLWFVQGHYTFNAFGDTTDYHTRQIPQKVLANN